MANSARAQQEALSQVMQESAVEPSSEEQGAGVMLADPLWGYKYKQEHSGLIQPFDFILDAVYELRSTLEHRM